MSASKILCIRRIDVADDAFILVKATKTGKNDPDVDLLATEGTSPYVGKVRQQKLQEYRSKSYHGDDEEFQTILNCVLDGSYALPKTKATEDLEIGAEITGKDPNQKLTIVLRKRIEQIAQRLGTLELSQNEEAEVELFDWAGLAVQAGKDRSVEVADLTTKYTSAQQIIKELESKLEELVKIKDEREQMMLSQFAALLNEKKLKIRNQQRVLAMANVDKKTLQDLEQAAQGTGQDATSSRAGKRKAHLAVEESDSAGEVDTENGTSRAKVDMQADTESDRRSTPEPEAETETDSDSDKLRQRSDGTSSANKASADQRGGRQASKEGPPGSKVKKEPPDSQETQAKLRSNSSAQPESERSAQDASQPPPRRNLPFTRGKKKEDQMQSSQPAPSQAKPTTDEETASDDDEL